MGADPPTHMTRGQAAIEFVLISVVMLLFFSVSFIAAQNSYTKIQQQRLDEQVYDFFGVLESEFLVANDAGEGYERTIRIPKTFSGVPFDLEMRPNQTTSGSDEISVIIKGEEYFYFVQTPVNGTIDHGWHTIYGGDPVQINATG